MNVGRVPFESHAHKSGKGNNALAGHVDVAASGGAVDQGGLGVKILKKLKDFLSNRSVPQKLT